MVDVHGVRRAGGGCRAGHRRSVTSLSSICTTPGNARTSSERGVYHACAAAMVLALRTRFGSALIQLTPHLDTTSPATGRPGSDNPGSVL